MQSETTANEENFSTTFEGCVPFDEFKACLGPNASKYSDKEIDNIRIIFDKLADRAFDIWLNERNSGIVINDNLQ